MNTNSQSTDAHNQLVRRLEQYSVSNPGRYRLKVLLLGLMGYVYIAVMLLLLAAALALVGVLAVRARQAYLAFKLAIPLLALGYLILQALWVKLTPPEGVVVTRKAAPRLFDEVETIRAAINGPRVEKILISGEFNASVTQLPRLGVLGWSRNYLVIGLPLLLTLSPGGLRAVLLHEFGHLSASHGKLGCFIYRVRATWLRLMESLGASSRWGRIFFSRFFNWYVPYFYTYSLAMIRRHEYDADRVSAELTSPGNAAMALVATSLWDRQLQDEFWSKLYRTVRTDATPPRPFARMSAQLPPLEGDKASEWLSESLQRTTVSDDTHPSLADRLKALNVAPAMPGPVQRSAASYFLGSALRTIVQELDSHWVNVVTPSWQERHAYLQEAEKRRDELLSSENRELEADDELEVASITELLDGEEAALPLYRTLLERHGSLAGAWFAVGRILVEAGDEEGVAHLEKAMGLDPSWEMDGCGLIYSYMIQRGREAEADACRQRWERAAELRREQERERSTISLHDEFLPHQLDRKVLARLTAEMSEYADIKAAWLARKQVLKSPNVPLYVLVVSVAKPWYRFQSDGFIKNYAERLVKELRFPGETFVLIAQGEGNKPFLRKIQHVESSLIYSK